MRNEAIQSFLEPFPASGGGWSFLDRAIASLLATAPTLDHDPIRLTPITIYILRCSMIFSENRVPPIGSKPVGMLFRDHALAAAYSDAELREE